MASDAHAHPFDLLRHFPGAEAERRRLGIACAASAWNREELSCHEALAAAARRDSAPLLYLCFAVHPQLPKELGAGSKGLEAGEKIADALAFLEELAGAGRLAAVGETGFDLYDSAFRETELVQDQLFVAHLEIARRHELPVVLHVRRAMHKIFPYAKTLKALPAVVFHSWPGTPNEGFSLLRRGINAFFSFGTTVMLNHKNAIRSCGAFPADRLLLETDAPYQPLRGAAYSSWGDLPAILRAVTAIRKNAGVAGAAAEDAAELERITDGNFFRVLGGGRNI
jgi:TatD DNase family protein